MHTAATRGHIGSWDGEAGVRAQRKASMGTQRSWEKRSVEGPLEVGWGKAARRKTTGGGI